MKWVAAAVLALCGVLMAGVPGVRGAQSSVTSFASSDNDKALIDRGTKLMTVDVRSGRTRVIHKPPERPGYDEWATWSPDGRHIAFRSRYRVPRTGGKERSVIEVVRPNGSGLTEMGFAQPHDAEVAPERLLDWSPNGRCLAWYSYVPSYDQDADLKNGPGNRFVVRTLSLTRHTQRVVADDVEMQAAPVSSPDGRLIAYTDYRGRTVVRRISGGGSRLLFRDKHGALEDWTPR